MLEIAGIDLVGAGDRAIGPDKTRATELTFWRVELLEHLSQLDEVFAALADARRQRVILHELGHDAAFVEIVVCQAEQRHERRPYVGMVGEHAVVAAERLDAGADHGDPGLGDLLLEVAVVPGKAGSFAHGVGLGRAAGVVTRLEEIVVVAEHGERRRARRARGNHVQEFHFGPVSQQLRQLVGLVGDRVGSRQRVEVMLHGPGERVGRSRIVVDVHVRRVVAMHREWRAVHPFREQNLVERHLDLADIRVSTRCRNAVAVGRARLAADKMVVLVRHDDKQRIGLVDAFRFETAEEVAKGLVVSLERRDIARRNVDLAAIGMGIRGGNRRLDRGRVIRGVSERRARNGSERVVFEFDFG